MTIDLLTLIVQQTKAQIYDAGLAIAELVGLNTSTWQAGDPTRAQFHLTSEILAKVEEGRVAYTKANFLDYATGVWLKVRAEQQYGVTVPEASFATTDVVLTNTGGGLYADIEAGDLTFKNGTTGKTYRNTTGGTLAAGPGTTLTVTVVAEEAGSASSAAAGEIDELVTQLLGVTCTNATAAVGTDEQDEAVTRQQCRDKLGRLGIGPKDAYTYVLRDPTYSGLSYVPRVRVYSDSDVGEVNVIVAGPSGAISGGDVAIAEDAVLTYATPLCITPVVESAVSVPVAITYQLWLYARANKTATEAQEAVEAALEALFASLPIGGDRIPPAATGSLYRSLLESTILGVFGEDAFRVSVSAPAGDTSLANNEVASLGTITPTITIVVDP